MTRTFGAPVGGRSGLIGGNFVLGSLASYVVRPIGLRSGIGSTSRPMTGACARAESNTEAAATDVPPRRMLRRLKAPFDPLGSSEIPLLLMTYFLSTDEHCLAPSEWVDVVQNRRLPQHDLPDHVADGDVVGEDRREPGAAGRQTSRHVRVVELDPNDERRRLDIRWRDGKAAGLFLAARNRLQYCLDATGIDRAP